MFTQYRALLADRRGFSTVYILSAIALIIMAALGLAMVSFTSVSTLVSQNKTLTLAVESRAGEFIATLNGAVTDGVIVEPSLTAKTDPRTGVETVIVSTTGDSTSPKRELRIKATTLGTGYTLERVVTANRNVVTHVTGFDDIGNPVWADSNEPNSFSLWSLAVGSIRPLTEAEKDGAEKSPTTWVHATNRLGIDSTGGLWAWGANTFGQAGTGVSGTPLTEPQPITVDEKYRFVESTDTNSFAVDTIGRLWAWGENTDGALGTSTAGDKHAPTLVDSAARFQSVTSYDNSTFAIDTQGQLWAWGSNVSGRLGTGSNAPTVTKPELVKDGTSFVHVHTSHGSTYAIDTAYKLWAWGANGAGQLGDGTSTARALPVPIAAASSFTSVSAANSNAAAIDITGKLWSWGQNANGQVGDGTLTNRNRPTAIGGTKLFSQVTVGKDTSFAIDATGRLNVWGTNTAGQFGNSTDTDSRTPIVVLPTVQFSAVDSTRNGPASIAVDSDGGLWAFGHAGTGAWTIDFAADTNTALRMPNPAGFTPAGWK